MKNFNSPWNKKTLEKKIKREEIPKAKRCGTKNTGFGVRSSSIWSEFQFFHSLACDVKQLNLSKSQWPVSHVEITQGHMFSSPWYY